MLYITLVSKLFFILINLLFIQFYFSAMVFYSSNLFCFKFNNSYECLFCVFLFLFIIYTIINLINHLILIYYLFYDNLLFEVTFVLNTRAT